MDSNEMRTLLRWWIDRASELERERDELRQAVDDYATGVAYQAEQERNIDKYELLGMLGAPNVWE